MHFLVYPSVKFFVPFAPPLRYNDTLFESIPITATASPAPEPPACRQAGSLPFQSKKETPGQARRNIAFLSVSFNEVLRGLCASFVSLCYNDTLVESLLISATASPASEPEPPFSISEGASGSSPETHWLLRSPSAFVPLLNTHYSIPTTHYPLPPLNLC